MRYIHVLSVECDLLAKACLGAMVAFQLHTYMYVHVCIYVHTNKTRVSASQYIRHFCSALSPEHFNNQFSQQVHNMYHDAF